MLDQYVDTERYRHYLTLERAEDYDWNRNSETTPDESALGRAIQL